MGQGGETDSRWVPYSMPQASRASTDHPPISSSSWAACQAKMLCHTTHHPCRPHLNESAAQAADHPTVPMSSPAEKLLATVHHPQEYKA